jgi:hypothetical protein
MGAFLAILVGIVIPLIIAHKGKGSRGFWVLMGFVGLIVAALIFVTGEGLEKTLSRWTNRVMLATCEVSFGFAVGSFIAALRNPDTSRSGKPPSANDTDDKV